MILTGEKVNLRPLRETDLTFTTELRNNKTLIEAAMMHPYPVTIKLEEEWFESVVNSKSNKNLFFAVENIETNELIGFAGLMNINYINRNCYHAIVLSDKANKLPGSGTDTLTLIVKFAFQSLNLKKVNAEVISENIASLKMHQKCGFEIEGTLKNQYYAGGHYQDVIIFSIFNNSNA